MERFPSSAEVVGSVRSRIPSMGLIQGSGAIRCKSAPIEHAEKQNESLERECKSAVSGIQFHGRESVSRRNIGLRQSKGVVSQSPRTKLGSVTFGNQVSETRLMTLSKTLFDERTSSNCQDLRLPQQHVFATNRIVESSQPHVMSGSASTPLSKMSPSPSPRVKEQSPSVLSSYGPSCLLLSAFLLLTSTSSIERMVILVTGILIKTDWFPL